MAIPNVFDHCVSTWIGLSSVTEDTIDAAVGGIVSDETIATELSLKQCYAQNGLTNSIANANSEVKVRGACGRECGVIGSTLLGKVVQN